MPAGKPHCRQADHRSAIGTVLKDTVCCAWLWMGSKGEGFDLFDTQPLWQCDTSFKCRRKLGEGVLRDGAVGLVRTSSLAQGSKRRRTEPS